MSANDFKQINKSCCFLCLEESSDEAVPSSSKTVPPPSPPQSHQTPSSSSFVSFWRLCFQLGFLASPIIQPGGQNNVTGNIEFCRICSSVLAQFSELFHRRAFLDTEINQSLGKIHEIITNADRQRNRNLDNQHPGNSDGNHGDITDNRSLNFLRDLISKKCSFVSPSRDPSGRFQQPEGKARSETVTSTISVLHHSGGTLSTRHFDSELKSTAGVPNPKLDDYDRSPATTNTVSTQAENQFPANNELLKTLNSKLMAKMDKATQVAVNKCEECSRVFARRHGLLQHIRHVHSKGPRFTCDICQSASYIRRHDMRRHQKFCKLKGAKIGSGGGEVNGLEPDQKKDGNRRKLEAQKELFPQKCSLGLLRSQGAMEKSKSEPCRLKISTCNESCGEPAPESAAEQYSDSDLIRDIEFISNWDSGTFQLAPRGPDPEGPSCLKTCHGDSAMEPKDVDVAAKTGTAYLGTEFGTVETSGSAFVLGRDSKAPLIPPHYVAKWGESALNSRALETPDIYILF